MGQTKLTVHRLFPLFQRIENGDIRVPAFQRSFSWRNPQVLSLLESVYKGYPVGTLLFWETSEMGLDVASNEPELFPDISWRQRESASYPLMYVIDGVQRLACLYNCLRWRAIDKLDKFHVVFDLNEETFAHYGRDTTDRAYVHLSSVFYPQIVEQYLFGFEDVTHHPDSLETVTRLRARFIEYEIPITTLAGFDLNEVISIFQRLNTTGRSLTREEIRRAEANREQT